MSLVSDSNACFDALEDADTPQQWPQCHRMDASPSRFVQDGFASLLNEWLRRMDLTERLACIHRMGHLSNFLLDILSVLGVHGITFSVARLHSLIAYFIGYIRIDPQIDVDGMLENRKRSLAGFCVAGKYLAIIQPFSALLANPKFRSEHSMRAYMQPSLDLLREWESRLGMEDIALVIRSCIALLESIKTYVSVLPQPRSAPFLHHELAELADEWTHCMPTPAPPEPGIAPGSPPELQRPAPHRNTPYCLRFQSNNCQSKACKLAHVCIVPDCTDSQASRSNLEHI